MKCINKRLLSLFLLCCITISCLSGCAKETKLSQEYDYYSLAALSPEQAQQTGANTGTVDFMSVGLCVADTTDVSVDSVDNVYTGCGGIFDITNGEVIYGHQLFKQMYPASTTKIMTAHLVLKHCNLSDMVTISENAVDMPEGAVTCGISVGDMVSVQDLLYALMLLSANDAAVALAEHTSGSVEAFAQLMTEEAKRIGATQTNFVNPNGLHRDDHYTTAYDMYLIFNEAIKSEMFREIINTKTYKATYQSVRGSQVEKTYSNTNQMLIGERDYPNNFTIVGGKTGTTYDAGKCLVLLVKDRNGNEYILMGFGCDTRDRLYNYLENQMKFIIEHNEN